MRQIFQIDEDKSKYSTVQRELSSLQESCETLQAKNQRLQQDLAKKDNQNVTLQVSLY